MPPAPRGQAGEVAAWEPSFATAALQIAERMAAYETVIRRLAKCVATTEDRLRRSDAALAQSQEALRHSRDIINAGRPPGSANVPSRHDDAT